jgi:hypothetical protein
VEINLIFVFDLKSLSLIINRNNFKDKDLEKGKDRDLFVGLIYPKWW